LVGWLVGWLVSSYITLRCDWCDIFLNVHAPTEDKIDGMKDSFNEQLERVLNQFPRYHMKILLGDFSAEVETSSDGKNAQWDRSRLDR